MKSLCRFALVAAGAVLLASSPRALEIAGVNLADKVSVGGHELSLNGAGLRTRLVFKVYVASLYLPQPATNLAGVLAMSPRRIQLNLLRTLSADQLVDALNEGLEANNTPGELSAVKSEIAELSAIMKAFKEVREKDVVALDFVDGATRVSWNGERKGAITGEAFNRALTRVWLGDKPVQPELKQSLLGG